MGMTIKRRHSISVWATVLMLFSGCDEPAENPSVGAEVVSLQRVLARLNGETITEKEFSEFLLITQGELVGDPRPVPRRELFREFLTSKLLLWEAKRAGTEVDESRVDEYLRQWTAKESEEASGLSEQIRDYLTAQKFLSEQIRPQVEVSLSDSLRYYEQNAEQFVIEDQAHVLEILTSDRAEAERIRAELEDGDIQDFKERAKRYSVGVTASLGGDLGFFRRGDLPEDFEKAIFSLKPGQLSAPFKSDHGFHIFLIEEWIPRHSQKFFEVRDQIFATLISEKEREATKRVLNKMLRNASIEVYDSSLKLTVEERSSNEDKNALD